MYCNPFPNLNPNVAGRERYLVLVDSTVRVAFVGVRRREERQRRRKRELFLWWKGFGDFGLLLDRWFCVFGCR